LKELKNKYELSDKEIKIEEKKYQRMLE